MRTYLIAIAVLSSLLISTFAGSCAHLNNCNGRGRCDEVNSRCICFNGFGSPTDIATYKAPDCSARVCPADRAWADVPVGPHVAHRLAECSNAGVCDRNTGKCRCFAGYEGEACQRLACPGNTPCSGHGRCVSLKNMGNEANAAPFGPMVEYGGFPESKTWDEDKIYGCVCDSTWKVGYGPGETQMTQWFGADCSLRHCPSNNDPRTPDVDETDCAYKDKNGEVWLGDIGSDGKHYIPGATLPAGVTIAVHSTCTPGVDCGAIGNKCFVECSNRGLCDYKSGTCNCFEGYYGIDCSMKHTQTRP